MMALVKAETALNYYYKEYCKKNVKRCRRTYLPIINHLKGHFGNIYVHQINSRHVNLYKELRLSGQIGVRSSDGTLWRELNMLLAACRFYARVHKIPQDDFIPYIKHLIPKCPPAKEVWLTQSETNTLLSVARGNDHFPPRVFRFCMLGIYCGQRKDAMQRLRTHEQVFITGENSGYINFKEAGVAESNKKKSIVPIADELMPMVLQVIKEGKTEWFLDSPTPIDYLFNKVVKKCNFNKNVTPHTLRHTYATQALQNGVTIWDVAGVLGDSAATVEKRYGHHCPDHLKAAVNFRKKEGVDFGPRPHKDSDFLL